MIHWCSSHPHPSRHSCRLRWPECSASSATSRCPPGVEHPISSTAGGSRPSTHRGSPRRLKVCQTDRRKLPRGALCAPFAVPLRTDERALDDANHVHGARKGEGKLAVEALARCDRRVLPEQAAELAGCCLVGLRVAGGVLADNAAYRLDFVGRALRRRTGPCAPPLQEVDSQRSRGRSWRKPAPAISRVLRFVHRHGTTAPVSAGIAPGESASSSVGKPARRRPLAPWRQCGGHSRHSSCSEWFSALMDPILS